ncbi:queuosine precursor transporter [Halosimplex pelagicum]|uniref:Probable queuosine precursor transporter n=1 Tax=Halosimplex pelagicum TaxID=869886 RepID=A0A7D5P4H7_9EURY|nr:queuosine precursor transporter [Halosimplex pelagicum]QLH80597.1 queuosine precursor transporter [Halosimplex pelagicum]
MSDPRPALSPAQVGLIGLFVTAIVTAQLTASKLLRFGLPFELPVVGGALVLPGAALAYALTFFASDCYSELYGRKAATVVVNVGFAMNVVMLVLVWSTIEAPAVAQSAPGQIDLTAFRSVLGSSTAIVVASLSAYVVSQNWDVFVFHWIREATDGDYLWLRNIGSTATSQLLDTVIFVFVGFYFLGSTSLSGAVALVAGQYLFKLFVAVADTPFVYAVVAAVRSRKTASATAYASSE